jgi:hypothetical protein
LNLYLCNPSINLLFFAAFPNKAYLFRRSYCRKIGGIL